MHIAFYAAPMKSPHRFLFALSFLVVLATSQASPFRLDYTTTDLGGSYEYDFTLTVDNNDNSYVSGQGWGWFIFGDQMNAPSPIADFVLTSAAPAPWTYLTGSSGYHNGPTFAPVLSYWTPALGDVLTWSGTSATRVQQGGLLFSTLATSPFNPGAAASFAVANDLGNTPASVPDASHSLVLLGIGLASLLGLRRRLGRG